MCAESNVKGKDESRRLYVGYGGFFAVGVFAVVVVISASAMPSWNYRTDSVFEFINGTNGFDLFFIAGSILAALGMAVFALRLTGRKICAMETLGGVMLLMVLILLVSATIADANESVVELFEKIALVMIMVTMTAMFLCNQARRRVIAGGFTLVLLVTSFGAFCFKDLAYAYNIAIFCFAVFLAIQNASLLANPLGGAN